MVEIIWTEPALEDVNEIAEYIALDNPTAAKALVKDIFASANRLKKFPKSGRKPPELDDFRYRELIVGPCRIFYRLYEKKLFILYAMRSERALRNFLLEDRDGSGS
ncbi:type II toxin-antitoxin system RelE/ParE family toxin [Agaribacter marinus]|uniref:Plasmid stabilization protein n=1 Tax=Agaribacter marinus TaxID=1431249 RepID=A0AA37T072_9ALTE|nr:type II toxin-antitoxin system RelE/ParE family toxin [Agaribacter marinus]GLR71235.1 plasmid stabilization protein [Agaribacter marinus]